ncbi:SDR family NAD(P)-dependent oxidoreductase [Cupriavidus metallidurans]|uniref:Cyclopentanol dehydrogenase (Short-chain dehydrogenase/reductase SDR) n=1 Tax=Cupriavidus metallidurans (strain ATCC 43123 / DSM 2839 / NBRC 102507 / CH34) TaxID=266264 RepID=Q1LBV3_CUPMC|nr:SDR family oxidoreductase [Cupriavidus metallidurans]ABF12373.1 Cyclopentanol dehydrogenase (short-chain dehydrogenase/reductase SDR) [Cupriavidus metallidurans CH34]QGS32397.1 SDR family oxidoreductase [Cupriavidus metallidurans]
MQLEKKVVLVTGAASGIGRQTCVTLAAAGARVFASDLNEEGAAQTVALIRDAGGVADSLAHDVTEESAWHAVVQKIESASGRLDGLVNSAGLMVVRPFLETDLALYRRQQAVNVDSVWLGCQAVCKLMTKTAAEFGSASIVNLSSILGLKGGSMHSAYCTSKGAVRLLTKALAVELGRSRIRVNSVHPGLVETPLGLGSMKDMISHGVPLGSLDAAVDMVAHRTPLGRWAQPVDVANVIAFLCADESRFVTGTELTVDGGYSAA